MRNLVGIPIRKGRICASHQNAIVRAAALACVTLLAGCAALAPKTPEQTVTERAKARWEAMLAGKVDDAYPFYSPGYRSEVSARALAHRVANQRVRWAKADFLGVSCEPEVCQARFDLTYKYRMPIQGVGVITNTREITEDWILADGDWFYVPPTLGKSGLR